MLVFFTAVYSGLTFLFACIGIAFVAYKLYQWYQKRRANNTPPNQDFEDIRRERLQREEAVSQYATESNLHLHHNAHQVVARFKDQQAHLEKSIADFDVIIAQTQRTNSDLNETNSSLQNRVIIPMQALLARIKAHYQEASSLVSKLAEAMTNATQSIAEREKELKVAIENIAESQASISSAMEKLPKVNLNAQYVVKLEEENRALENGLKSLTEKAKKLLEINKRQERVIDLLQQRKTGDTTPYDCRLFGSEANREISSVVCEGKQDTTTAFVDYGSESPYRDTAITV